MKRAGLHIVLLITMLLAVGAHTTTTPESAVGTWQFKASMPEPRSGATAVALGDFIYVIGGKNASGAVSNKVDRYDPTTDTWDVSAPLGEARFNAASVVWNNTVVVIGGRSEENTTLDLVEQYNPATNTWTALPGLIEARDGHTAVVLDEVIYAVGGSDALGRIFDSVEIYEPEQNSWIMSDQWELDFPRASFAMVAVNDSAFAIGGFNTFFGPLGFVQRFHPDEGTAGREGLIPARGGLAAVYKGDRVFALGGITASDQAVSTTNVFFPSENTWLTESPMNTPRAQFPAVVFGNDLYVFGGEDAQGTITGSVEVFITGVAPIAEDDVFVTSEDLPLTFNVLENDVDQVGSTLVIASIVQPEGGTVSQLDNEGTLTYTPNNNFNGTDRFRYTIVNGEGSVASAEVEIRVFPVNDPPVFVTTPVVTGVTGAPYQYNVQVLDVDGPVVTITADNIPGWLSLTDNGNGEALLTGTPAVEDVGDHLISLRGSDSIAEQVQSFFVTVIEGVPPVPMLLSPVNNADSVEVPVRFTWSDQGATSWDLQVSTNDQFTNIEVNVPNLSEPMVDVDQLNKGLIYYWRVRATNGAGTSDWSAPSVFSTSNSSSVSNEDEIPLQGLVLHPPYPNPARGMVWVELDSESTTLTQMTVAIYDLRGREVVTLFDGIPSFGNTRFSWDGTNEWGQSVASGTYFVRMTHNNQQQIQSLVFLR